MDNGIIRDKAALIFWDKVRRQRDKGQLGNGNGSRSEDRQRIGGWKQILGSKPKEMPFSVDITADVVHLKTSDTFYWSRLKSSKYSLLAGP